MEPCGDDVVFVEEVIEGTFNDGLECVMACANQDFTQGNFKLVD